MRAGNADDVRPLTDAVYARDAEIRRYRVKVLLHSYPGPGDNEVLSAASERVEDNAWKIMFAITSPYATTSLYLVYMQLCTLAE